MRLPKRGTYALEYTRAAKDLHTVVIRIWTEVPVTGRYGRVRRGQFADSWRELSVAHAASKHEAVHAARIAARSVVRQEQHGF